MFNPKTYHVIETLHDGSTVEIRAQKPEDRKEIIDLMEHASADTLYHRFFAVKRHFSEKEEHFFFDVNFVDHVVLIAVAERNGAPGIVGGARFVVIEPGKAEVAFSVVDDFQHHGLGAVLMHAITAVARESGITEFTAEVLSDNASMLAVFEHSGLITSTRREGTTVHVTMLFPGAGSSAPEPGVTSRI
ncbi:acetyltransferase (GNAT) family protein [Roseiarcus fermentans]|uniref:Acetyltransferase (GNAT) family protein n=1 Tax=Roseiarcus fermentans TaxID=1473586 RepID=A0A366FPF4_9HYPH|nr:GNAT family N-acetyltransferase [Roseiarcus fermentans]RBP15599.1 acetyltransferase (GNAT) family protein [Roseiarcus fermentans]